MTFYMPVATDVIESSITQFLAECHFPACDTGSTTSSHVAIGFEAGDEDTYWNLKADIAEASGLVSDSEAAVITRRLSAL